MNGREVVVTGVGLLSALGSDTAEHGEAWWRGASGVRSVDDWFGGEGAQLEARVTGFHPSEAIRNRMLRKLLSRSASFAVAAAGDALDDAGVRGDAAALVDCGLYVGSLSLEIDPERFIPPLRASLDTEGAFDISLFARRGTALLDPLFLVRALPNAGACGISVEHQVLGPNTNVTNGTTSGLTAVARAAAAIRRGTVDCAVAGGYDTLLVIDSFAEHLIAGRLSAATATPQRACRPFDRARDGYALGEGAAFLFLEAADRARARGATVYGMLASWAETTAAADGGGRDPTALVRATEAAMARAAVGADAVGLVCGDGLATVEDDRREAAALTAVLDGAAVPFSAATSAIGFTGAASGVFSLGHGLLALRRGLAPALTASEDLVDPVHVLREPAPLTADAVLVWNSDRGVKNLATVAVPGSGTG